MTVKRVKNKTQKKCKTPFFSIIIPIYNVEKYLEECIQSVICQSFSSFEVILVDDGSLDKCPQICDKYAKTNKNITVIHKNNGGLSSARNAGLRVANGDYVVFLDSDDYWNDFNALNNLKKELDNCQAEILVFNCYLKYPDGRILEDRTDRKYPNNINELSNVEQQEESIKNEILPGSAWIMAIKKNFLLSNKLFFKEGIRSEDTEWMFRVLDCLPRFLYSKYRFYVYRKNRIGSITNTVDKKHIEQYLDIISDYCDANHDESSGQKNIISYVAYHYLIVLSLIGCHLKGEEKKELKLKAEKYKYLLNHQLNAKVIKANKIFKCFGFNALVFLLGIYLKKRDYVK